MSKWDRFRQKLLGGQADNNIDFGDLCHFVEHELGFIPHPENSGSHRVYGKSDILEIIDLQPRGHEAKPYQVRQIRKIMVANGL